MLFSFIVWTSIARGLESLRNDPNGPIMEVEYHHRRLQKWKITETDQDGVITTRLIFLSPWLQYLAFSTSGKWITVIHVRDSDRFSKGNPSALPLSGLLPSPRQYFIFFLYSSKLAFVLSSCSKSKDGNNQTMEITFPLIFCLTIIFFNLSYK